MKMLLNMIFIFIYQGRGYVGPANPGEIAAMTSHSFKTLTLRTTAILALAATCTAVGCSDDETAEEGAAGQAGEAGSPTAGTKAVDAAGGEGGAVPAPSDVGGAGGETQEVPPLYVSSMRVFNPEGSVGYLISLPSLDEATEVDLEQAVEIEDAWVFGDAKPYFYAATIFEPVMTRWEVTADGKFKKGPVLNLVNQGVKGTYTAAATPIFSAEKSYFIDSESMQVVVWNPTTMTLIKTIPLDVEPIGDLVPKWTAGISVTKDRVYVSSFWAPGEGMWSKFADHVRVTTIDPKTDKVIDSVDDTRCSTLGPGGVTSDGTAYFSPWDYTTVLGSVFGEGFGSAACALRVVPPKTAFDTGYDVDLSSLVEGRPAGSLQLLNDEEALIHVWHDDLVGATAENWADTRFKPGYYWYRWKLSEESAELIEGQDPNSEGGTWIQLDGKTFSLANDVDFTVTTLYELDADGALHKGVTIPGWATNVIRVR
jgi:hypothetical protein